MARNKLLSAGPERDGDVEGKRYPLHLRTTRALREKLGRCALESGRSLAQEVEARIQKSFDFDMLSDSVGGDKNFAVALRVAHILDAHELETDRHWSASPEDAEQTLARLNRALPKLLAQPITAPGSDDPAVMDDAVLLDAIEVGDDGEEVADETGVSDGWLVGEAEASAWVSTGRPGKRGRRA